MNPPQKAPFPKQSRSTFDSSAAHQSALRIETRSLDTTPAALPCLISPHTPPALDHCGPFVFPPPVPKEQEPAAAVKQDLRGPNATAGQADYQRHLERMQQQHNAQHPNGSSSYGAASLASSSAAAALTPQQQQILVLQQRQQQQQMRLRQAILLQQQRMALQQQQQQQQGEQSRNAHLERSKSEASSASSSSSTFGAPQQKSEYQDQGHGLDEFDATDQHAFHSQHLDSSPFLPTPVPTPTPPLHTGSATGESHSNMSHQQHQNQIQQDAHQQYRLSAASNTSTLLSDEDLFQQLATQLTAGQSNSNSGYMHQPTSVPAAQPSSIHPSTANNAPNMMVPASSHSNHKRFACPHENCHQMFARRHDLQRHMRIHENVKPFQCERCGKAFTRLDAYNRHLKISLKYGGRCRTGRGRVPKDQLPELLPQPQPQPHQQHLQQLRQLQLRQHLQQQLQQRQLQHQLQQHQLQQHQLQLQQQLHSHQTAMYPSLHAQAANNNTQALASGMNPALSLESDSAFLGSTQLPPDENDPIHAQPTHGNIMPSSVDQMNCRMIPQTIQESNDGLLLGGGNTGSANAPNFLGEYMQLMLQQSAPNTSSNGY